jgi:hypothetical protein
MLAVCQCWLCANAGCVPMLAVCQCWLCADAHRVDEARFVSSIFFKFLFCVLHADISQSVWFAVVTDDRRQEITKSKNHGLFCYNKTETDATKNGSGSK